MSHVLFYYLFGFLFCSYMSARISNRRRTLYGQLVRSMFLVSVFVSFAALYCLGWVSTLLV